MQFLSLSEQLTRISQGLLLLITKNQVPSFSMKFILSSIFLVSVSSIVSKSVKFQKPISKGEPSKSFKTPLFGAAWANKDMKEKAVKFPPNPPATMKFPTILTHLR